MQVYLRADLLLSRLESILEPDVFDILIDNMTAEYLGEMDVRTAIVKRPDLFERAFLSVLGNAGEPILKIICDEMRTQHRLKIAPYSKAGDLVKCIKNIQ